MELPAFSTPTKADKLINSSFSFKAAECVATKLLPKLLKVATKEVKPSSAAAPSGPIQSKVKATYLSIPPKTSSPTGPKSSLATAMAPSTKGLPKPLSNTKTLNFISEAQTSPELISSGSNKNTKFQPLPISSLLVDQLVLLVLCTGQTICNQWL